MCGYADPRMALPELEKAFSAKEIIVTEYLRDDGDVELQTSRSVGGPRSIKFR